MMGRIYDVVIVGGGPGGYTAALYAARAGLDTLVLEKLSAGGQMALSEQIDNYPGFEEGIDGFTLGERMRRGAEKFGAQTKIAEVLGASLGGRVKELETSEGRYLARTVVIATGATADLLAPQEKLIWLAGASTTAQRVMEWPTGERRWPLLAAVTLRLPMPCSSPELRKR